MQNINTNIPDKTKPTINLLQQGENRNESNLAFGKDLRLNHSGETAQVSFVNPTVA